MANYNTFVVVDCKTRRPVLTTSSVRKAKRIFEIGKRIEVWNNNELVNTIHFSDTKKKINPLFPYIKAEKEYIKNKQMKAEIRNKRKSLKFVT